MWDGPPSGQRNGLYRACSPMNIMDPVLSELLSRLGVGTDFGDTVLTCPETQGAYEDTPLHVVAYYNDVALLSALMPFVTTIDARGDLDLTPLARALMMWCVWSTPQMEPADGNF